MSAPVLDQTRVILLVEDNQQITKDCHAEPLKAAKHLIWSRKAGFFGRFAPSE